MDVDYGGKQQGFCWKVRYSVLTILWLGWYKPANSMGKTEKNREVLGSLWISWFEGIFYGARLRK